MSRQSNRNSSSNIYSEHFNDRAEEIADRTLNGEFVNPADAFGTVPDTAFGTAVIRPNDGRSARDKARTHEGGLESGNDDVTNVHAEHERRSLRDGSPTHADESVRGHK